MANDIVTLQRNGFAVEFSKTELTSLTQLWRMAGSPENKNPSQWKRLPEAQRLTRQITKELNKGRSHIKVWDTGKGRGSETRAHHKLAIEYAGYLSVEFKSWMLGVVGDLLEDPEGFAANILIASHNKTKVDRAKNRILCTDTNKQTAEIAHIAGLSIGKVHNDRYSGLYRKTAAQLRKEAGIKENETPLDVMSSRDLQMNGLANTLALEANNADLLFDFANDIKESYERRMGKKLEPIFEEKLLRPNQARAIAYSPDYQVELPLGGN
jgi:KilA-N domain